MNNKLNTEEAEDKLNILTNDTPESGTFNQLREPLLDDPPTVLSELYILILLMASSKLTCKPLTLDVSVLLLHVILCYSFAIVCSFLCAFVQGVLM